MCYHSSERRGDMKTEASAKSGSKSESTQHKPHFTDRMVAFASTGIACPLAWGFLMNAFGGVSPSAQLPWTLSYLLLAVAVLIFAAISRKAPAFFSSGVSATVAGALGAFGSLLLTLTLTVIPSIPLQFAAMVLCACVLGWLYLQWGTFYAKLDLRHAVIYLLLANIGGSTLKAITHFIPIEAHRRHRHGKARHPFRVPQSARALEGCCCYRRLQLRNCLPGEPDFGKPSSNTSH